MSPPAAPAHNDSSLAVPVPQRQPATPSKHSPRHRPMLAQRHAACDCTHNTHLNLSDLVFMRVCGQRQRLGSCPRRAAGSARSTRRHGIPSTCATRGLPGLTFLPGEIPPVAGFALRQHRELSSRPTRPSTGTFPTYVTGANVQLSPFIPVAALFSIGPATLPWPRRAWNPWTAKV